MLLNKGVEVMFLAFQYSVSDTVDPRREGLWRAGCVDQKDGLGTCRRQKSAIRDFIGNLIVVVSVVFSC